jgi:GntR family transcriptional regulator
MADKAENAVRESPYQRLQRELGDLIAASEPGTKLPTEPDLAAHMGVSRSTLREAMRSFEAQGLLIRRQGAGTFVVGKAGVFETGIEVLESLETIAGRLNLKISMGENQIETIQANEEQAKIFKVRKGTALLCVSRVMHAEGRSIAYLQDILPRDVLPIKDLQEGFTGSVLDMLIRRGKPQLDKSFTEINAVSAPSRVARALEIQRGDVLLMFEADLFALDGSAVDHSHSYFLPGYFRFHVLRKIGVP